LGDLRRRSGVARLEKLPDPEDGVAGEVDVALDAPLGDLRDVLDARLGDLLRRGALLHGGPGGSGEAERETDRAREKESLLHVNLLGCASIVVGLYGAFAAIIPANGRLGIPKFGIRLPSSVIGNSGFALPQIGMTDLE
jgi:hypothetical protein